MKTLALHKIRHQFLDNTLRDPSEVIISELQKLKSLILPGKNIAIAVGSRGIDNLPTVVTSAVQYVKQQGANPFIVPAMGSHGGATDEGQQQVLEGYGISEEKVGAPIRSSMEAVHLGITDGGHKVYIDKNAYEADGIILINKIKPHTDFRSRYESGLVKMAVIGLGKEKGAVEIHNSGTFGLSNVVPKAAELVFATGKIFGGIAMIENAYDRTMHIEALQGDSIMEEEPKLLAIAKANRPKFPIAKFDVLIVDRMGKNISGVGIDTNIVGRIKIYGQADPPEPEIKSILVSDLTDESHGNATGIGIADVITKKLFEKIDFDITNKNIATSSFLERGKVPFIAENDVEAFNAALRNSGRPEAGKERIIRIKDTLHLDELYISDAVLSEVGQSPEISVVERDIPQFDVKGNFVAF